MQKRKIKLALVGVGIENSYSPQIHRFILSKWGVDCEYELLSLQSDGLSNVVYRLLGDFDGFNVTIPFKREIISYLDEIEGEALKIGSVNTVLCVDKIGYNTDGDGLCYALKNAGVELSGKRALVLGAGGVGRSVAKLLKDGGAQVFAYRRDREKLKEFCLELGVQECLDLEEGFDIIINATGVGSKTGAGSSPIRSEGLKDCSWAVELAYEPTETEFLRLAKTRGVRTLNGLSMLFYQAYYADCLYLKKTPSEQEMDEFYKEWSYEIFNH